MALEVFRHQAVNCNIYARFVSLLGIDYLRIESINDIPFLPVEFFKNHTISSTATNAQTTVFTSSSTTGTGESKHFVTDMAVYEQSFIKAFELFYGAVSDWCILGLLPSYLQRQGSSLIYMVQHLQQLSKHPNNGMYLTDFGALKEVLKSNEAKQQKTMLIGVTYALLDFAESHAMPLKHTCIMETGGMKGQRKEMLREEVHAVLSQAFATQSIYSEYGMTELLSQGYSQGNGIFDCPPWMKILVRDTHEPQKLLPYGVSGCINIIDLANVNSCSFLATQDLGKCYADGTFEVLGRYDHSDVRGCNLLVG